MELDRNSFVQRLWNQMPETDAHRNKARSVIEIREQDSATAFANGLRAYAEERLKSWLSANRFEASMQLIENSRHLMAGSRRLILQSKNTLAFARVSGRRVN